MIDNNQDRNLFEAALQYRSRGWSVVPLKKDKKPALARGQIAQFKKSPADEIQLERWFLHGQGVGKIEGVGILCGQVSGGLVVRDFDSMEVYTAWATAHPELATTLPTVATGRGRHVYLRCNCKTIVRKDGELRSDGGYVCAPPMLHPSGTRYCWIVPLPDGPLPTIDPITVGLVPDSMRQKITVQNTSSISTPLLEKMVANAVEGTRHHGGVQLACQLRDAGISEDEAKTVVIRYAVRVPSGNHPYTEDEALTTLRSIYSTSPRATSAHRTASLLPVWILNLRPKPYRRVMLERIAELCRPIDAVGSLGFCIKGIDKLAELANVSDRTAKRYVKAMVAEGTLVVVNRGGYVRETGEAVANVYAIPGVFGMLDYLRDDGTRPVQRFDPERVTRCHPVLNNERVTPSHSTPNGGVSGTRSHPVPAALDGAG